jgi:hypothetical protein
VNASEDVTTFHPARPSERWSWGGDQLGTRFYKGADGKPGYEAMAAQGLNGADAFARFYGLVAKGLRDMANRDDYTEWENTARVPATVPGAHGG